jgi:DNA-binding NarL/FixJ family response regulator
MRTEKSIAGTIPARQRIDPTKPNNPSEGLLSESDWKLISQIFELSDRESVVAKMLFTGQSRQSIAGNLRKSDGSNLSPETVRVYIDRLFGKLNVRTNAQMVQRVIRVLWQASQKNLPQPSESQIL